MKKTITDLGYVIQDVDSGLYLRHDGISYGLDVDHPYIDVEDIEAATHWKGFDHVTHVVWWYCDTYRHWLVIDRDCGEKFEKSSMVGKLKMVEGD